MPVVDAYGERKTEQVLRDTWGHLDAIKGIKYPGTILFAESEFGGEQVILRETFKAVELDHEPSGPWFYEGIHDWLCEQDTEPGKLYQFEGWYRLCRNGRHQFVGKVREHAYPC